MSISRKKRSLSKPRRGEKIDQFDLSFVRARNRNKAHSLLLDEFATCGLSKAELAKMLGKRPEQISRWLAGPGNMTLDTLSDLMFAIRGDFLIWRCADEIGKGKANLRCPDWIVSNTEEGFRAILKVGDSKQPSVVETTPQKYTILHAKTSSQRETGYGSYTSGRTEKVLEER